jgi:hypothetical protein
MIFEVTKSLPMDLIPSSFRVPINKYAVESNYYVSTKLFKPTCVTSDE